ncbi:MAG: glycosyltransferase family 9 protein [Deltaproteobacteria bacterium]|nr:glycosyltransferase family 9 protein [Deltaproteobacteria bacterium]
MKILIIKLSSLGDVIQTLSVLSPLRKKYPEAHISWLIEEEAAELIIDHPLVDQVLVFRKNKWLKEFANYRKWVQFFREISDFIKEIRSYSYDLIIDFQGLFKSGIFVGICRGKRKLGFSPAREKSHIFLDEKIPYPKSSLHAVDRYIHLIESLGCSCQSPKFFIPIRQNHRDKIIEFFQEKKIAPDDPIVLLHPGTRWKAKLWEEEKWAVLGDQLHQKNGAQIIFTGSREDFSLVKRIIDRMKFSGINTAGRWGLKELAFLQTQADVIVIPDSGPMHLAAAVGTPVVALFGPTHPALTGPYGKIHMVTVKSIECRPCFRRKCSPNKCMTEISVREVREATEPYLSFLNIPKAVAK